MKAIKRTVAALLATLMLATSTSFTLAAEEYSDKEAVVVAKVNAAGIMTGTDKGFEPSKTLTRAEAAAIMVRMKGISEATVKQNAGTTLFSDVAASNWASGYVNVASNYGIIKGVGANLFAPDKEVTVAEFYTMAVRALNAGQLVDAEGTWPTNYVNFAIENGLAEDVAQIYTANATRMTAATIVVNTLTADMWAKDSVKTNGEITWRANEGSTILRKTLNIKEYEDVTFSVINTKDYKATASNTGKTGDAVFASASYNVAENAELAKAKIGVKYTVWYDTKEEEIVGFWVPVNTDTISFSSVKSLDLTSGKEKVKLKVDGEDKTYSLKSGYKIYMNGKEVTSPTANTLGVKTNGSDVDQPLVITGIAYLDKDDSDVITSIYAETFKSFGVVKKVASNKIEFESGSALNFKASTIWIDEKAKEYSVTKNGKEISINDIEEEDALFYNLDGNKYTIEVINDTVEGKVTAAGDNKVTIDGKKYEVNANLSLSIAAKNEGVFYLYDNKIVMFLAEAGTTGDVAIVSALRKLNGTVAGEVEYEIKYTTMDGKTSDWTKIDVEKSVANVSTGIASAANLANYTDLTEVRKLLGKPIAYEIKSGKFVEKVAKDSDNNDLFKSINDYVRNDKLENSKAVLTRAAGTDTIKYTADDVITYYTLDSDVKVFELDVESKTKPSENLVTLKEIDASKLDDVQELANSFVTEINYDEDSCAVVVINKSNIKADRLFAYVATKASYDDDDDDTDENEIYEVVFAGENEIKVLYAKDLLDNASSAAPVAKESVYELGLNGEIIKNAHNTFSDGATLAKVTIDAAINKQFNNGDIVFNSAHTVGATVGTASERYTLADNCIVMKKDKVSSFSAIRFLEHGTGADDKITDNDVDNSDKVNFIYTYTDKDGNKEIVAIVYGK